MRQPLHNALCLLPLLLFSCGDDSPQGTEVEASAKPGQVIQDSTPRSETPEAKALRRVLDLGLHAEAVSLLEAADGEALGIEFDLLKARMASLEGRDVDVTPLIERARAAAPRDPRVYCTAAELHAASGRLETAKVELARGLDACGRCPELLRAQGVLELCRQGHAQQGLDLFLRALKYDADLPFTLRPRAQAYLLLAKMAMKEQRPQASLGFAQESLSLDPLDVDARLFFVDALAGNGDYPNAVKVLEELEIEGVNRRSELALMYKRAAIGEMVLGKREASLEYFRLARGAGLSDDELGTGADQLQDAAQQAMLSGMEAFKTGEYEAARLHFEQALSYDSHNLLVKTQLAVVLIQQEAYLPAATYYREVLDQSIAENLKLPDPIHIFLARALYAAGDQLAAKRVLQDYMEREPDGEWGSPTISLLGELK